MDKKENSPSGRRDYSSKDYLQVKQNLTHFSFSCKENKKKIFNSGKVIGTLENNVFIKKVRRSSHFLRVLQAWGTDKTTLLDLKRQGCKTVRLIEKETGRVLEASLERILSEGIERDLGFGPQVFLPEKEWEVKDPAQRGLFECPA
jgi:hypothetical protein